VLLQGAQDLSIVLQMFLLGFTKYEDVMQIYDHKGVCEWMQYIIHHPHECGQCISQVERHDQPLKETFFRLEACLPYINFLQSKLGDSLTSNQSY
jgi:hypothetical protein